MPGKLIDAIFKPPATIPLGRTPVIVMKDLQEMGTFVKVK